MSAPTSHRVRRKRYSLTADGVPDIAIYERHAWTCQMPVCLAPDGRAINPALARTQDRWAPSIDHIVRLADGGDDTAANKRAAHNWCNQAAAPPGCQWGAADLTVAGRLPEAVRERLAQLGTEATA